MDSSTTEQNDNGALARLPVFIISGLVFLLPIFIIPHQAVSFQFNKTGLITVAALATLIAFAAQAIRSRVIIVPKNPILLTLWLIPLAMILAAALSPAPMLSFFGYELDTDTVAFVAALTLIAFLVGSAFTRRSAVLGVYTALLFSAWVVMLIQVLHVIFPGLMLSLGIFSSPLGNVVGPWNDLALFLGLVSTLVLISLVFLPLEKMYRAFLFATIILALSLLALINFAPAWILIGAVALGLFVYTALRKRTPNMSGRRGIVASLAVFVFSTFFAFGSFGISDFLNNYFGTAYLEARPSLETTLSIGQSVYNERALFGTGPNLFKIAWDTYQPSAIATTPFWDVEFNAGFGTIPTALVTSGIVGGVAWCVFLGMFLFIGIRALFSRSTFPDEHAYYLTLSSFVGALWVLVCAVIYLPGPVILALGFICVGLFAASLNHRNNVPATAHMLMGRFGENPHVPTIMLSALIIVTLAGVLFVGNAYANSVRFGLGTIAAERGDINGALKYATEANSLVSQDRIFRVITAAHISRLTTLITSTKEPTEEEQETFRTNLSNAIEAGLKATTLNKTDYRNWIALGGVYHAIAPLNIEGAYENAMRAYDQATLLAPNNPYISLTKAQLEIARGDIPSARVFLEEAITKKGDYAPALFLFSQVEATLGNAEASLARAASAALAAPNNEIVLFQLGTLHLAMGNLSEAKEALQRAVVINPNYANARFLLGQTLATLGEFEAAQVEFEAVRALNPGNAETKAILDALNAGINPFQQTPEEEAEETEDEVTE